MNKLKDIKSYIIFSTGLICKDNKMLLLSYLPMRLLESFLPIINLYIINIIIDYLLNRKIEFKKVFFCMLMYSVGLLFYKSLEHFNQVLYKIITQKAYYNYDLFINKKIIKLPLSFLDTSYGKDIVEDVKYSKGLVCQLSLAIIDMSYSFVIFVTSFSILIVYNKFLVLLTLLIVIPVIIIDHLNNFRHEQWRLEKAPDVRRFSYYRWMLTDPWPAKDVRIYDLTKYIKSRYEEEKAIYIKDKNRLYKQQLKLKILGELILQCGIVAFTIGLFRETLIDKISIGDFIFYNGVVLSMVSTFKMFSYELVEIFTVYLRGMKRVDIFRNELEIEVHNGNNSRELEEFEKIEFKNVVFKYPYTDNNILKGVSFKIKRGEKIALVGINGAGKSTIIKLMIGLYRVNSGQILINGYPIEEYNREDICRIFSVLFQNFMTYPLTLKENIAISQLENIGNTTKIAETLKKSVTEEFYEKFKNKLDTPMTKRFSDQGIELSKGQWQKIALARAYFKDSSIIIFDEPSAALDAESEEQIFTNFESMAQDKTGIMISHRISSARLVDKIIVVNNGFIEQQGTHDELMRNEGVYQQLFNLQKEKYVGGGLE